MTQSPGQVTVIIPTRDRPVLLEAALRSVLQQTRRVDQIVVVDDGSSVPVSAQALARLSPVIELLRQDAARGVSAARRTTCSCSADARPRLPASGRMSK